MDLFERSLHYMLEIMQGKRTPPEGMVITAEDEEERARQVGEQAAAMGVVVVVATIIVATFALRLIFRSFDVKD